MTARRSFITIPAGAAYHRIVEVFKVAGYWRVRINGKLRGSFHTKAEANRAAKVAK